MGSPNTDQPMGVFEDFGHNWFKPQTKETKDENSAKMAKAMEMAYATRNQFIEDLSGKGGAVVKTVLENLATRVDFLIKEDPECQAYKKILGDIYEGLQVPQKIAKRLAKLFEIEGAPKL
jgi:hypothetical protein